MKKGFITLISIFMLSYLVFSTSITHASPNNLYSDNLVEIDQNYIEELSKETGVDFSTVNMENFEEEFSFLVNDPVFRQLEERLVLDSQEVYIHEGEVAGQWVPLIAGPVRVLASKVGKKVMGKAWKVAKPHVTKAMKNLKRYKFYSKPKSGRYIGIIDKKSKKKQKTIFALDYHKYSVKGKRTTKPVLHYHKAPNLKTHYNIYPRKPKMK
ncbi:hypothetical protein [Virgibacillus proomii]|uniref:hypothetical protein n=1 Tax=Virgibacillus proomii TaxID=84407 RepID=UPI001C0F6BF3|nr:hypothetical protein [Virgibacillus proomii]MBU5265832.1 hypothetical protein [Virgibacillus proomii]